MNEINAPPGDWTGPPLAEERVSKSFWSRAFVREVFAPSHEIEIHLNLTYLLVPLQI